MPLHGLPISTHPGFVQPEGMKDGFRQWECVSLPEFETQVPEECSHILISNIVARATPIMRDIITLKRLHVSRHKGMVKCLSSRGNTWHLRDEDARDF